MTLCKHYGKIRLDDFISAYNDCATYSRPCLSNGDADRCIYRQGERGDAMSKPNLSWYVYRQDWNTGKIEPWNIFEHWRFAEDVADLLKRKIDKATFADAVKSDLMYYFWAKSEYEIILKNWVGRDYEVKIDVYDQVMLNFSKFIDYLWENRKRVGGDNNDR